MNDIESGSINLENSEEFRKFLEASLTDNSIHLNSVKERFKHPDIETSTQQISPSRASQLYSLSPSIQSDDSQHEESTAHSNGAYTMPFSSTLSYSARDRQASANAHSVLWNLDPPYESEPDLESSKHGVNLTLTSQTRHSYKSKLTIPSSFGGEGGDFTDTFSELDTEEVGERTVHSLSLSHSHFGLETLQEIECQSFQRELNPSKEECSRSEIVELQISEQGIIGLPLSSVVNNIHLSANRLANTELDEEDGHYSHDFDSLSENSLKEETESGCDSSSNLDMLSSSGRPQCISKRLDPVSEITEDSKDFESSDKSDVECTLSRTDFSPSHLDYDSHNISTNKSSDSNLKAFNPELHRNLQPIENNFPEISISKTPSLSEKVQAFANKEVKSVAKLIIQKNKARKSRIPCLAKTPRKIVPVCAGIGSQSESNETQNVDQPEEKVKIAPSKKVSFLDEASRVSQVGEGLREDRLKILNSELEEELCRERNTSVRLISELQLVNGNLIKKQRELSEQKNNSKYLEEDLERVQIQLLSANARIERLASFDHIIESVGESKRELELRKSLTDQDELIQSYQRENEKIYNELKRVKEEKKSIENRFHKETQILNNQIYNLKSQLGLPPENNSRGLRDPISADRYEEIDYLEKIIEKEQNKMKELERQQKVSMHQISEQKTEISDLKQLLRNKSDDNTEAQEEKVQLIKSKYEDELIDLRKKLKWYSDNQKLMEKDLAKVCKLQARNNELEREFSLIRSPDRKHSAANSSIHSHRIKGLEKQNSNFRDQLPEAQSNSEPLIPTSDLKDSGLTGNQRNSEIEIARLSKALADKENDCEMKLSSFKLKLQNLETSYNEKLKTQNYKLSALQREQQRKSHPHATVQSLLREVESVRQGSVVREQELTAQLDQFAQDNKQLKALIATYRQKSFPPVKSSGVQDCGEKTKLLDYCNSLETEIAQLRDANYKTDHTPSQQELNNDNLNREIEKLRSQISLFHVQLEDEKSRHTQELSSAGETHRLELERELKKHKQNLNALKVYHAVQYSDSQGAQLTSDNTSLKLKISWLEDRLEEYRTKVYSYEQIIDGEKQLKQKIQLLSDELVDAKQQQRPEMHHFATLKRTVTELESRLKEQDKIIRSSAAQNSAFHQKDYCKRENEMKSILAQKDLEIEDFKRELDSLLILMKQLQRQNLIDLSSPSSPSLDHAYL